VQDFDQRVWLMAMTLHRRIERLQPAVILEVRRSSGRHLYLSDAMDVPCEMRGKNRDFFLKCRSLPDSRRADTSVRFSAPQRRNADVQSDTDVFAGR
jgi:hypothetical protein